MSQFLLIVEAESRTIAEEFRLASVQGAGTPQEVADFRENAVQTFLTRFYSKGHAISKGKLTDYAGNQSNSIDCLVLSPNHPHFIDSQGKFRLQFPDGCEAAIEVKPDLARQDELERALNQGISVKKLRRTQSSVSHIPSTPEVVLENSFRIPFYIFCIKSFETADLYDRILKFYTENGVSQEDQIDGICIFDQGMLLNIRYPELNYYDGAPAPIGGSSGWYFESWQESSLIGFLIALEQSFSCEPKIVESIMTKVLRVIPSADITKIGDVN